MAYIKGRIVSSFPIKGGIPNATIEIPGWTRPGNPAGTDPDGSFIIGLPDKFASTMKISASGYRPKTVNFRVGTRGKDLGNIELTSGKGVSRKLIKVSTVQFINLNFINLIFAVLVTIASFIFVAPKMPGIFSIVAPLGAGVIVFLSSRGKGILPTIGYAVLFSAMWFIFLWLISAARSGTLTNIETWLKPLDWLHWVGVPRNYIDNFKEGIRNVLGTVTPKPPSTKPVAEKEGTYQALQVKFGSKYNNYVPPTLYANAEYSLPVTVANLNPSDSGLTIKNFYISSLDSEPSPNKDADMDNKTGVKLMCGKADLCDVSSKCTIEPGKEEQITIDFKKDVPCKLTSLPVTIDATEKDCETRCKDQKFEYYRFIKDSCICKRPRTMNNVTDLCDTGFFGKEVKIEFKTVFDFSVDGNSGFGVVQKEDDVSILPKPKITTSTGPLSVTVYFVPDYLALNKQRRDVIMFTTISNKGGGSAEIKDVKVEPHQSQIVLDGIEKCGDEIKKIGIVNDGEERDMPCKLQLSTQTIPGAYATFPVSIKVDYEYTKTESKTLSIYKTEYDPSTPEGKALADIPGYCPQS